MTRPKDRDEFRRRMAEAFAGVLEEKGLEWKKGWNGAAAAPKNGVTKACYRGSNAFWLSLTAMSRGYRDPRWVTMVQIRDAAGKYHPGEKWSLKPGTEASWVEYWYPWDRKGERALTWEEYRAALAAGRREDEFRMSTRYTAVFNADRVEGMREADAVPGDGGIGMDDMVRRLSDGMGVPVYLDGGDEAWYSPSQDAVHLPMPRTFQSEYAFNAAALHELAHATGHPARLDRPMSAAFGTEMYAYEELVAEMCACFTGFGLEAERDARHLQNHRAYVQSWIRGVRERPEALVRAIRDARGAADYLEWKAGIITEREYREAAKRSFETRPRDRERDACR